MFREQQADLERSNRWADELNAHVRERDARVLELQDELARDQEHARTVVAGYNAKVAALDEWVEDIPYRETRRYVKVVIGAWSAYRILAGGSAPQVSATVPILRSGANF